MSRRRGRTYYVYILTNRSGTLYSGVTSSIEHRIWQHNPGADVVIPTPGGI